jgi:hypothetical protein
MVHWRLVEGERKGCSGAEGCCPRDLEQQREERGGMHPCGCSKMER